MMMFAVCSCGLQVFALEVNRKYVQNQSRNRSVEAPRSHFATA